MRIIPSYNNIIFSDEEIKSLKKNINIFSKHIKMPHSIIQ